MPAKVQPTATGTSLSLNILPTLPAITTSFTKANLSTQDQATIYAAVIQGLAGPDDTFRGHLEKPIIYIVRQQMIGSVISESTRLDHTTLVSRLSKPSEPSSNIYPVKSDGWRSRRA